MDPKENICFQKEYLIVDKKCQFQVRPLKVKMLVMTTNLERKFYLICLDRAVYKSSGKIQSLDTHTA